MKNKIVLNVLIGYLIILSAVLLMQLSEKETQAIEPLPTEITTQDKLKSAVVLAIDSPVTIIDEKQFLIDEDDSALTPIIDGGKVFIPVNLLKTAFGAHISFDRQTKETIVRLENKAMFFSNSTNNIKVLDNINEETLVTEAKSKIINDRFYIPLRSFADIFEKEIFYTDDLIIISDIENIFDPIEEMDTIEKLTEQVRQLPVVGNLENLKRLTYNVESVDNTLNTTILNKALLDDLLIENERVIIYKTNNYNFYATSEFIEGYFLTDENEEIFSFKIPKFSNEIEQILTKDGTLIVSYMDNTQGEVNSKTYIYDISERENIKELKVIESTGDFYSNILSNNSLYTISKMDTKKNLDISPTLKLKNKGEEGEEVITEMKFGYNTIFYFPDINDTNCTIITYTNLLEPENTHAKVYLGMGDKIAVDENRLFIATNKNNKSNVYLFNVEMNGINYANRVNFNEEIKEISFDIDKNLLKATTSEGTKYLDENLNYIK